ncbi:site-2 protease family protein [bacterium]|nr:site-2 protease family protein [bacterium]
MDFYIILVLILITSVVIHEVAHGYAAYLLGDSTAKLQGRLTLNPLVHLDPMMSVIVPGLLIMSGSPILFGAAKPVPYNPYNFTDQKWGEAKVAIAGPLANIVIALVVGIILHLTPLLNLPASLIEIGVLTITLNIFLAFFNLLPIPPLDGSKVWPMFLPYDWRMKYEEFRLKLERNIFLSFALIILLVFYVLGGPLYSATLALTSLISGVSL